MELKSTARRELEFLFVSSWFLLLYLLLWTGSLSQCDAFWFLILLEFADYGLILTTSPLGLRPKTQEGQCNWFSWVRRSIPGSVGYCRGGQNKCGRPGPTLMILCMPVSRENRAGRVPKMSLSSHTKNLFSPLKDYVFLRQHQISRVVVSQELSEYHPDTV